MPRLRTLCLVSLALTAIYLYAAPAASLPYVLAVLLHAVAGVAVIPLLWPVLRNLRALGIASRVGWLLTAAGAGLGLTVAIVGAGRPVIGVLQAHMAVSILGAIVLAARHVVRPAWLSRQPFGARLVALLVATALTAGAAWAWRVPGWERRYRIENPLLPPETQDGEGDGPRGPFFPSSVQTAHGKTIPAEYFMDSQACQRCHPDIFEQWQSSMHRFSSFNNQWYRKSIEYMQEVAGVQPSKWCAGCHDPALLFSGKFDTPIKEIVNSPEAHAGLGCVMCHSVTAVKSTMGQGDYTLEYPALASLAGSQNPVVRAVHDLVVHVNPEPHRRVFMKPFVRAQTAEFCSACHKVHLDHHVNNYRWLRGFNEYDNWQASGVSGMGARSFYYPPASQDCVDCHMPSVPSTDKGAVNGVVHSHRFPAANTAVPMANHDTTQLNTVTNFLKANILSVDVFGIAPATSERRSAGVAPRSDMASTFAVGEEAELSTPVVDAELTPLTAPLDKVQARVRPGDTYRLDVVVRTRRIGHFFPGGTVDAFDVWVELKAVDATGRVIFWSGKAADDGKGPVEPGAHFYRSLMVDAKGNPINKRNAWATRSLVYVRLIPPGAADTVHYRLPIPTDATGPITVTAKVNYRKFAWWNTQFAYAGERQADAPPATKDYDDAAWTFTGDTSTVSGKMKAIPDVPVVTIAEHTATLQVDRAARETLPPATALEGPDWSRWNDYGIGLLLQGHLKGAEAAFTTVTQIAPQNPDGWVNIGRVRVQEGNLAGARTVLDRALSLSPNLARANYFYARVLRQEGEYDQALDRLRRVLAEYPKDRVARNDAGRILFLQKRYADAIREFETVLAIDPEDVQAHYNLMLCYQGLGQAERAQAHETRYLRFKADESAQAITGPYRLEHPDDNNERQPVHEHVSIPLDARGGR